MRRTYFRLFATFIFFFFLPQVSAWSLPPAFAAAHEYPTCVYTQHAQKLHCGSGAATVPVMLVVGPDTFGIDDDRRFSNGACRERWKRARVKEIKVENHRETGGKKIRSRAILANVTGAKKKSSARKSPTSGGGRNGTALYTAVTGLALRATAVPPWRADVFGQRTGNRGYHGTGNVESRSAVGTEVKRMVFAFLPSAPLLETNSKKKFKTIKSSTVRTSAGAMVLFFIATTYATQGCFVLFHFVFCFLFFFVALE